MTHRPQFQRRRDAFYDVDATGLRTGKLGPLIWIAPAVLSAILLMMAFASISGALRDGAVLRLDTALLLALRTPGDLGRPVGPGWLLPVLVTMTAVGGVAMRWLVCGAGVGLLLALRRRVDAAWLATSLIGASLIGVALKTAFSRPRPQIAPHLAVANGPGFPSGHALAAAALYLTIGAIIASAQPRLAVRIAVMSLAILLMALIGFSRVYLGVHWPSDVLAGWAVGAGWALTVFAARRAIDPMETV